MVPHSSYSSAFDKTANDRGLISLPIAVCLALIYTAAILIAAEKPLRLALEANDGGNIFASTGAAMVFLRLAAGVWALVFTFFQGAVLGIFFSLVTRAKRPRVGESWGYVLASQVPFALAVFVLYAFQGFDASEIVRQPWMRHLTGIASATVYTILVAVGKSIARARLLAFLVLAVAVNSALLFLSGQVPL